MYKYKYIYTHFIFTYSNIIGFYSHIKTSLISPVPAAGYLEPMDGDPMAYQSYGGSYDGGGVSGPKLWCLVFFWKKTTGAEKRHLVRTWTLHRDLWSPRILAEDGHFSMGFTVLSTTLFGMASAFFLVRDFGDSIFERHGGPSKEFMRKWEKHRSACLVRKCGRTMWDFSLRRPLSGKTIHAFDA